jgi:hypothetical protein
MKSAFMLSKLAEDVEKYVRAKKYLTKAYLDVDDDLINLYFFTESVEKFPEDSYEFEKKLEKKYIYDFDIKIIPYKSKAVKQFKEDSQLTPVLE